MTLENRHAPGSWLGHPKWCPPGTPTFLVEDATSLSRLAGLHDTIVVWYPLAGPDGRPAGHVPFTLDHSPAMALAAAALSGTDHRPVILAATHQRFLNIQAASGRNHPGFSDPPPGTPPLP